MDNIKTTTTINVLVAHELLEALERCRDMAISLLNGTPVRDADEVFVSVNLAIKKARGEL